jgi:hypothetical protein
MSEKPRTPTAAVIVLVVVLVGGLLALRLVEMPWWGWVLGFAGLAVAGWVFARFAAHAPRHDRFVLEDRWATALPVSEALERISAHFAGEGATVHESQDRTTVEMGSDRKFRFLGIESARGRRAFPSVLNIAAEPSRAGAVLSARARDNLGWYLFMRPGVPRWAAERNAHLIDTCRSLTRPEDTESQEPGGTHLGRLTEREPDPGPGPMDALNISNLVKIWLAWLILTALAVFAGLDLSLGTYAAFTGMAVVVTAGMWWAERRRKSKWAARDHDLR